MLQRTENNKKQPKLSVIYYQGAITAIPRLARDSTTAVADQNLLWQVKVRVFVL